MELNRRDFLRLSAISTVSVGLFCLRITNFDKDKPLVYAAGSDTTEIPIIWLATGSCTGCSVSLLNSLSPSIRNILIDEVVPAKHLSLRFHSTIMAAEGELALEELKRTASNKGKYILVVEGAIPTKDDGIYCEVGETHGKGITGLEQTKNLGKDAMLAIAIGTCSSYGGIPAAAPNHANYTELSKIFADAGIKTPVINVPGCPPHPDWFVGTVATILISGIEAVKVDAYGRPLAFYGKRIHEICPRNGYFQLGQFSKKFSDPYCMYQLGCKGPVTYADCPVRLWNSGNSWCVGANSLCIGCVEPGFPDMMSPFMKRAEDWEVDPLALPKPRKEQAGISPALAAGLGAIAGAAVTGAGVAITRQIATKTQTDEKSQKE